MVAAQSAGKRVEDLSQGDAFTQVFANPDGTWTTESASEPVRAQDEKGTWAPLDLTLVKVGGRLVPKNAPGEVSLSAGGDRVFADAVPEDGPGGAGKISWGWPSELPEPVLDGPTATYEDVIAGGGDLVVTATASGFTHNVVLDERPKEGADGKIAPFEFTVPVTTPGAEVRTNPAGGVEVVAKAKGHEVVAAAPRPVMWDSSAPEPQAGDDAAAASGDPAVAPVKASVVDTAAGGRLVLEPDMDFLTDPATVYPVTVDPQFTLYSNADTWVMNTGFTSGQGSSSILRAGTQDGGASLARSFMKFPGEATWNGTQIRGAVLKLWNSQSGSCNAGAIRASRITASWAPSTLTWSNQPAATATDQAQYSPAHGATGCAAAEAQWNVTNIVQGWASGSTANYGLRLAAYTETNSNTWRTYWSADSAGGVQKPRLVVTYNRYPSTPTSLQVAPSPDGSHVASTTPTLSAVVTDPDGGQVAGYFEVKQGSTVVWSDTSAAVASGGTASVEVPSGKLTDGGQYTVTARGQDTVAARSVSAASTNITIDANVPDVIVTSNVFTNGTWTNTLPSSATTTLNGSADTTAFLLDYDGVKANIQANSSGDATMPYTPTAGWHVLDVTPIDAAGNYGPKVTFAHGAGSAAFTTPMHWTPSTASFPINLSSRPSATTASLQWRLAGQPTWITATKMRQADGTAWTGTVTSTSARATTGALVWNATEEENGDEPLINAPALLEIRGCFQYSGSPASCSAPTYVGLYSSAFGGRFPQTDLGPAQVALLNGEAMISDSDAADSTAGVERTFASMSDGTLSEGVFGPGWSDPHLLTAQSDSAADVIDNRSSDGSFVIVDAQGGSQTFVPATGSTYKPLQPTGDATALSLEAGTGGAPDYLRLTRPLGLGVVVTTWEWKTSDTGDDPAWTVKKTDAPGASNDVSVESTGQRLTFVRQSEPGASATCNETTQTEGCRALKITYSGSGNTTRVSKIERIIGATAPSGIDTKVLATYHYTAGRLTEVCGSGASPGEAGLCTEYGYNIVAGRTMLSTMKPSGLTAWRFGYDALGRLSNVKRERPEGGDATWSIDYDLAPTSAGLPDMTAAKIAEWGQSEVPTKVYAVYEPSTGAAHITKADLVYTTSDGKTTNTASTGPEGWLVETSWYDTRGNVVQELDAAGWARVQAAEVVHRPRVAAEASSYSIYNTWGDESTVGTRVVDEYGPAHTATLEDGTTGYYRSHTARTYDDDPSVDPALVASRPGGITSGLVVEETTSTATSDRSVDSDHKVVRYGYEPIVSGDANGWELGTPTSISTRLAAGDWLKEITRRAPDGRVIEVRQPGGSSDENGIGNDAHSVFTSYYTAQGAGDCGGKADWAGQVCKTGQTSGPSQEMPVTHFTQYDADLNAVAIQELVAGSPVRSTTNSYDGLGRLKATTKATTGPAVSADSITTTYGYDPTTGLLKTLAEGGDTTRASHDSWGRPSSYTDASGSIATTSYDAAGRPVQEQSGGITTSTSYDDAGYVTSRSFTGVGSFEYEYKPDGSINRIDYPNELAMLRDTDELGTPTGITYKDHNSSLLAFTVNRDASGRVHQQASPASSQEFAYDDAARLVKVKDTRATGCVTRAYTFNASSDRMALQSYGPDPTGQCQETSATATISDTYDAANRISSPGYIYDALGRTISTPARDTAAGGQGALQSQFRADDMVASLTQEVVTTAGSELRKVDYLLDPEGRIGTVAETVDGAGAQQMRYRYRDNTDSPSSISTSADGGQTWTTTDYLSLPDIGLVAEKTGTAVRLRLSNLHGDLVADADATGVISSYAESDEYGKPLDGSTASNRYGWLGDHQRSTDTVGGLMLMGVRLYNPATGKFLSTDPITNGGANRYGYPTDPVNLQDYSGEFWGPLLRQFAKKFGKRIAEAVGKWLKDVWGWLSRNWTKFWKDLVKTVQGQKWRRGFIVALGAGINMKVAIHRPHHNFSSAGPWRFIGLGGFRWHLSITIWRKGMKNNGIHWQIPFGCETIGKNKTQCK